MAKKTTAPRKPQDHKPKKVTTLATVVRGIPIKIAPEALDDWELVEVIAAIDDGDQAAMMQLPRVLKRLIGQDAYKAAKDILRDDAGRVSAEAMGEFVGELFTSLAPNS